MTNQLLISTDFTDIHPPLRGKVRDIFDLGERLLIVTTDRISAYDYILPQGIPGKGIVLNKISEFWFKKTSHLVRNHLHTTDIDEYPDEFKKYREELEGRSMLVVKTRPLEIECIVRGYLAGSGWREYRDTGEICGIRLPDNLRESEVLDEPVFTPSTKASEGTHDENIPYERAEEIVGSENAKLLSEMSRKIYLMARDLALDIGIIIADTKFEFGIDEQSGQIILIDEVLTPDSSRFWPLDDYEPGRSQKSYDKQFVRDYLDSIKWDRKPPVPNLPDDIVMKTKEKYESMLKFFNPGDKV